MNNNKNHYDVDALLIERMIASTSDTNRWPTPTERFLLAAQAAAQRAADFRKLTAAARTEGFQHLSLPDYLAWISRRAGLSLARILPPSADNPSPTTVWVNVAKSIGLPLERIRLHLRIWVAERLASEEPVAGLARGGTPMGTSTQTPRYNGLTQAQVTSLLDSIETQYSPQDRACLAACLTEVE